MSIVLEALNKAQKEKEQNVFTKYDYTKNQKIKSSYKKIIIIVLTLNFFIISIISVFFIFFYNRPVSNNANINSTITPKYIPPATPIIQPTLNNTKSIINNPDQYIIVKNRITFMNGPELKISGVIEDSNQLFVMVDSDMYKKGDLFNGFTFLDITYKNIKIKYKDYIYDIPT